MELAVNHHALVGRSLLQESGISVKTVTSTMWHIGGRFVYYPESAHLRVMGDTKKIALKGTVIAVAKRIERMVRQTNA